MIYANKIVTKNTYRDVERLSRNQCVKDCRGNLFRGYSSACAMYSGHDRKLLILNDLKHIERARINTNLRNASWVRDLTKEGIEPNPGPRRNPNTTRAQGNSRRRRQRGRKQNAPMDYDRVDPNRIQMGDIMPARKYATLKYADGSNVRNNPGGNFLVYSMRINDLYDPDPALLSGSVSNFKEMMQFYSYYRVLHTDVNWTVVNLETFPLSCGIVFSQTNLTGVLGTLSDAQNAFENDFVIPIRVISEKGGVNKTQFNVSRLDLSKLLGVGSQYRSESNYTGLGLATPTTPLWANFIVFAPTGAVLSNGYVNSSTLYFHSEFFGRLNNRS